MDVRTTTFGGFMGLKRFDFLCIIYIIALLAFGFDDNASSEKNNEAKVENRIQVQTIASQQPAIHEHISTHGVPMAAEPTLKRVKLTK